MVNPDPTGTRILVVEDDAGIAQAVCAVIARLGASGIVASNGKDGIRRFFEEGVDLVVLDVGLPVMDGWQVLERIRDLSDVPILMLTARDLEQDKVRGLKAGADDYLTKPFGIRELGARIEALLRRARTSSAAASPPPDRYRDENCEIDWVARQVRVEGEVVPLTTLEFRLLETFVRHPGQALSSDQLLQFAWSDPYAIGPDRVKFTVLRLRRKLGWGSDTAGPLEAVRGYGYRYRPNA
jgi:DNA-binding response OmpR family regulator